MKDDIDCLDTDYNSDTRGYHRESLDAKAKALMALYVGSFTSGNGLGVVIDFLADGCVSKAGIELLLASGPEAGLVGTMFLGGLHLTFGALKGADNFYRRLKANGPVKYAKWVFCGPRAMGTYTLESFFTNNDLKNWREDQLLKEEYERKIGWVHA